MKPTERAQLHRALGDDRRLRIVDALAQGDLTPVELGAKLNMQSNLLAHHLGILERSGLVVGRTSEGDRRRRYLELDRRLLSGLHIGSRLQASSVLFVCTHNSARSQFAEALLGERTDVEVQSAGTMPADEVHPKAISAAAEMQIDLRGRRPKPYREVRGNPDLVISVCDRAREAEIPFAASALHWSIPDPVIGGRIDDFRAAFDEISKRIGVLAAEMRGAPS